MYKDTYPWILCTSANCWGLFIAWLLEWSFLHLMLILYLLNGYGSSCCYKKYLDNQQFMNNGINYEFMITIAQSHCYHLCHHHGGEPSLLSRLIFLLSSKGLDIGLGWAWTQWFCSLSQHTDHACHFSSNQHCIISKFLLRLMMEQLMQLRHWNRGSLTVAICLSWVATILSVLQKG